MTIAPILLTEYLPARELEVELDLNRTFTDRRKDLRPADSDLILSARWGKNADSLIWWQIITDTLRQTKTIDGTFEARSCHLIEFTITNRLALSSVTLENDFPQMSICIECC